MTRQETYARQAKWFKAWQDAPKGEKLKTIDKMTKKYNVTRTAIQVAIAKLLKKNNL
jgi:DNA-binding GntR family transcriptional regulator